ncbi:MAG: AmmeMemoRadiSam system protein A, partial [Lachnospiraceae bacterium]|nr:AmmeMemoRadiSam system protein A [Lachnospiraceae bacterium]
MPLLAGYMVPHPPIAVAEIGRGEEKKIQATLDAFDAVAADIAALKPDTIIVTSPHSVMYRDYFHISPGKKAIGNLGRFRAPQVQFEQEYDTGLVAAIEDLCDRQRFPAGTMGEVDKFLDH